MSLFRAKTALIASAALAAFGLYQGSAQASCGSYVLVNGRPVHSMNGVAGVDVTPEGLVQAAPQANGPANQPVRQPCNGPQCREAPPPMLPPAPPTVSHTSSDLFLWMGNSASSIDSHRRRLASADEPAPAGVILAGIFRPPRLG